MKGTCMPRVEPILVEALRFMSVTRWDWTTWGEQLHNIESVAAGGEPQQNQGNVCDVIILTLKMTSINAKGQKQLSPQQLTHVIQSYLGISLFKQAVNYQTLTKSHSPYLDFAYHQVPLQSDLPTKQQKVVFSELFKDLETKIVITMDLVRILQYGHYLMCLAVDPLSKGQQNYFIVAIVFERETEASAWKEQYSFLTQLKVAEPFKVTHKISTHDDTEILITRPENIKVHHKFKLTHYKAEEIRVRGNTNFKEKKFIEALTEYELSLGLTQLPDNRRQRAILYANSSQCLFEMRLFKSALIYATISASLDNTYPKGIYRKLMCLLELKLLKEVPMTLRAMTQTCPSEYEKAQLVAYRHNLHSHGIFDWKQIFEGSNLNFGQYSNPKLNQTKDETIKHSFPCFPSYICTHQLHQHQMILFSKPLIYKNASQSKFGQNYTTLIKEIQTYCQYEDDFYQQFHLLPNQEQVEGHQIIIKNNLENIARNEIHAKCLRCLELEKNISKREGQEHLGIWDQLFRFKQECMPNCTYLHVKGGLAVFAVRDIAPGETLSIDFLNSQTQQRNSFMEEKLGISCECPFCQWACEEDKDTTDELLLYELYLQSRDGWRKEGYYKMSLFYLWHMIFVRGYKQKQLMKEYLVLLEEYPLWQCIINCLVYLRVREWNSMFDFIKSTIKKALEKYFKLTHYQAVDLLKKIL